MVIGSHTTDLTVLQHHRFRIGRHTTPTGVFQILQKNKDHYSSTYNNAPMPYMQRLTWRGIALHAGDLPGYPASHGCIRMPAHMAERFFHESPYGTPVSVYR